MFIRMVKNDQARIYKIIFWAIVISLLHLVNLNNNLLFHTLVELFSIVIAYVIFLVAWESKTFLENRYLLLIGISYFFIGSLDLLHTLSYERMGMFPGFGTNLPTQLWIASRYMEGISFLIASVLLMSPGAWNIRKNTYPAEKARFAWEIFFIYTLVSVIVLLSIFVFRIFPDSYIEGVGLTTFKIVSEYIISLILICSLVLLYFKRDRFEKHVFRLLAVSIILTTLAELVFTMFTYVDDLSFAVGHYFKLLSFYLIYMAIVSTGFSEPYNLLFRELKQSEEALRQKTFFLQDDQGRIYRMLGVQIGEPESELLAEGS